MNKKLSNTTLFIWLLTCLLGSIFVGIEAYIKHGSLSNAFLVLLTYFLLGLIFSFYTIFLLIFAFKILESRKIIRWQRIIYLVITASILTSICFIPLFILFLYSTGRFRYDTYNLLIRIVPVYLLASVTATTLIGDIYLKKH